VPRFPKPVSKSKAARIPNEAEARAIAVDALIYLTEAPDQLLGFLDQSGLTPVNLRQRAQSRELQMFVLEYMASNESLLLTFAANRNLAAETVAAAAQVLGGPPPSSEG
jgi:hypothetical protein